MARAFARRRAPPAGEGDRRRVGCASWAAVARRVARGAGCGPGGEGLAAALAHLGWALVGGEGPLPEPTAAGWPEAGAVGLFQQGGEEVRGVLLADSVRDARALVLGLPWGAEVTLAVAPGAQAVAARDLLVGGAPAARYGAWIGGRRPPAEAAVAAVPLAGDAWIVAAREPPAVPDGALRRVGEIAVLRGRRAAPPVPAAGGRDPALSFLRELAEAEGRARFGAFLAEGPTLAARALQAGLPVVCIAHQPAFGRTEEGQALLEAAEAVGVPCLGRSEGALGTVTPTRPVPTVLAAVACRLPPAEALPWGERTLVLAAEGLQNPDNLGMLLRSADALGAEAVVVSASGVDPLHRQAVRAARGAVGRLPVFRAADLPAWLAAAARRGVQVVATTPREAAGLDAFPFRCPLVLAVGNEDRGLGAEALAACPERVRIPMAPGQDSLNVAVAAAIALYEAGRTVRRGAAPVSPDGPSET
jgi:tRNA G18 (ribose-2'-O)-methylase SpoU